jgi:hypothetical protein
MCVELFLLTKERPIKDHVMNLKAGYIYYLITDLFRICLITKAENLVSICFQYIITPRYIATIFLLDMCSVSHRGCIPTKYIVSLLRKFESNQW